MNTFFCSFNEDNVIDHRLKSADGWYLFPNCLLNYCHPLDLFRSEGRVVKDLEICARPLFRWAFPLCYFSSYFLSLCFFLFPLCYVSFYFISLCSFLDLFFPFLFVLLSESFFLPSSLYLSILPCSISFSIFSFFLCLSLLFSYS